MIYFSVNIKFLRKKRGLSQTQLADAIGVKANTISNYENDVSAPDFELLEKIIKFLDIDVRDILFNDITSENFKTKCAQNVTLSKGDKEGDVKGEFPNVHNSSPINDSDIDKCRSPEIVYKEDPAKDEIIRLQQKNIALLEDKVYQLKNQLRIASFGDTHSIQTTSADVAAESQKQLNVERGPHPNQAKSHQ